MLPRMAPINKAGAHSSTAPAGPGASAFQEKKEHEYTDDEPDREPTGIIFFVAHLPELRHSGQRHSFIIGNVFCQLPCGRSYATVVVALPEIGNHQASGVSRARIVDHGFQPVANLRPVLPLVRRYEQHHTVVLLLLANAELLEQIVRVGLDVIAIERLHRDDGHLRAGLLFEFRAQGFQLRFRLWMDDAGKVGHVAGRANLLEILSSCSPARHEQEPQHRADSFCEMSLHLRGFAMQLAFSPPGGAARAFPPCSFFHHTIPDPKKESSGHSERGERTSTAQGSATGRILS